VIFNKLFGNSSYIGNEKKPSIDWWILILTIPILMAGLITMHSFSNDSSYAYHQIIVIILSITVFLFISVFFDTKVLRLTTISITLFVIMVALLGSLSILGKISHGAQSWYDLGILSFQPSDFAKVALIIILAKYFSRRHIEIANVKHILVSGFYAFVFFLLILMHSGVSKKAFIGDDCYIHNYVCFVVEFCFQRISKK
jgi:rod shape determining protein RodA